MRLTASCLSLALLLTLLSAHRADRAPETEFEIFPVDKLVPGVQVEDLKLVLLVRRLSGGPGTNLVSRIQGDVGVISPGE